MPGRRPERLGEQIKEELSLIIGGEVEDPRLGFVTVTGAKLSADLRTAKIYVSILGDEDEVKGSLTALRRASGFIRHQLGAVLRMRYTPELHFVYDDADVRAARIEELLSEEAAKARAREASLADQATEESNPPEDPGVESAPGADSRY